MTYSFTQLPVSRHLLSSTILFGTMAIAFMPIETVAQDATGGATQLAPLTVTSSDGQTINQDNNTIVPRLSVSAMKADTPLVETPRSVSVVTREEMEQRAVTDMIQATRYSSGVTPVALATTPASTRSPSVVSKQP